MTTVVRCMTRAKALIDVSVSSDASVATLKSSLSDTLSVKAKYIGCIHSGVLLSDSTAISSLDFKARGYIYAYVSSNLEESMKKSEKVRKFVRPLSKDQKREYRRAIEHSEDGIKTVIEAIGGDDDGTRAKLTSRTDRLMGELGVNMARVLSRKSTSTDNAVSVPRNALPKRYKVCPINSISDDFATHAVIEGEIEEGSDGGGGDSSGSDDGIMALLARMLRQHSS